MNTPQHTTTPTDPAERARQGIIVLLRKARAAIDAAEVAVGVLNGSIVLHELRDEMDLEENR